MVNNSIYYHLSYLALTVSLSGSKTIDQQRHRVDVADKNDDLMESKQSPSDKKLPHYIHILEGSVTAAYDDFEDSGADEYINEEGPESESDDGMAVEEEEEESKLTKQTKTKKHGRNDIAAIRNTTAATGTPTVTVVIGGNKRKDKYVPSSFHIELNFSM